MKAKIFTILLTLVLSASLAQDAGTEDDVEYPDADGEEVVVEDDGWIPEIEVGAWIGADLRHLTEPPHTFTYNENDLGLRVGMEWDRADASGSLRLRGLGFSTAAESADLEYIGLVDPWSLELESAYLNLYGLPLAPVDVSIGKQEVGWGVGDELRTYNEVNPGDYEDPLNFGEHLGVNMVRLTGWFSETWRLEGIFIPGFTPARLPAQRWQTQPEMDLGEFMGLPLWLAGLETPVEPPESSLAESAQYGVRVKGGLGPVDLELSYIYNREQLPVPTDLTVEVTVTPEAPPFTIPVNVTALGTFPRRHIAGASFAADVFDLGLWGELAAFVYPEDVIQTQHSILGTEEKVLYPAGVFFKWMGGVDYGFDGWYAQLQYVHGLYNERGAAEMGDYFILALEKGLFYDALKIRLAAGLEVPDPDTFAENWGFILLPELTYEPLTGVKVILGGYWLEGEGEAQFAGMEKNDEVYLKVRVDL
jgi:hypothetical protein